MDKAKWNKEESDMFQRAGGIIDSEYEALEEFTSNDLFDYLSSMFPKMTREMSNQLYANFF